MTTYRLGLVTAALATACCLSTGAVADGYLRGSVKDAPMMEPTVGSCYLRADVGYSWSRDPDVRWSVTDPDPNSPTAFQFVTDRVTDVRIDNTWLGEVGAGCGSGPRGIRGEVMLGYHGKRNFDGTPGPVGPGDDAAAERSDPFRRHHQNPDVQRLLRLRPLEPLHPLRGRRRRSCPQRDRGGVLHRQSRPHQSHPGRTTAGRSPGR